MKLLILTTFFVVWRVPATNCQPPTTVTQQQQSTSSSSTTPAPEPPIYLLVSPSVFRPSQNYTVSMNILRRPTAPGDEFLVRLSIVNRANDTFAGRVFHEKNIELARAQIIDLTPPDDAIFDPTDGYRLMFQIENVNGDVLCADRHDLRFDSKALSIFVQTDRAVYRPAALVQYRAILLRSDLKPYNDTATIKVYDPNGNLISQIIDANLTKGVYSGKLQLADECLLGDWRITVDAKRNGQQEGSFTVDQYILPKFDVQIKTPSFITVNQNLSVLVSAKYTYGKGVSGKAKVSLQLPWHQWHMVEQQPVLVDSSNGGATTEGGEKAVQILERTLKLNRAGEATFDFYNSELKAHNLLQEYFSSIRIIASVTEDITEIERNATHTLSTYRDEVKLITEKQGDTFKPGLQYNVAILLRKMDDNPLDATLPKRVQITTFYNYPYNHETAQIHEEKETKIVEVDAHATTQLTLNPPINCTSLRIEALYDISGQDNFTNTPIFTSLYVDAAVSPSATFLQLISDKEGPVEVGKTLSFTVKSTKELSVYNYQVMSRSKIVAAAQHTPSPPTTTTTITFTATPEMAPKSRLVVYAIGEDSREVLVDALDFEVDGVYQNDVQLTIDHTEALPKTMVNVKVTADKDSFVGLLAVDQSVLLLKSGNDLTREKVELDLENFDSILGGGFGGRNWEGIVERRRRRRRSFFRPMWGISGNDAESVFSNAGMIVLTDALLYREEQPIALRTPGGILSDSIMLEAAAMPTNKIGASGNAPQIRRFFPHTWIWHDSETGEIALNLPAPDTITTWIATAFAVNAETGLGIAAQPVKLKTYQDFFIRLSLPYSVKRGEKFALLVQLFNYEEKEVDITVTLEYDAMSGFDLLRKDGTVVKRDELVQENIRVVSVAGSGATKPVYFPIVPSQIGEINITIAAISADGKIGDAVSEVLRVEPQGYKVSRNIPFIIDLSTQNSTTTNFDLPPVLTKSLEWPSDLVDASEKARIEIIGDIMGPLMDRVGDLVEMPYGCGEQNMLNLVPNILVLKYLEETKRSKPELEAKAKRYIEAGVQRELTFRHDSDKSFSAFGNADPKGSTWLTAFVIRAFNHAKPYTFIDEKIIHDAISWLNSEQMESGAFAEHGEVHHKDMQGGAQAGGITLTAYVTIAMLENGVRNAQALRFLEKHFAEAEHNAYALSIICYALKLAGSEQFEAAWEMLEKQKREEKGTLRFGAVSNGGGSVVKGYSFQARPVDIETTSYALLSLLDSSPSPLPNDSLALVRWLISQRNALGGFSSTQDTVVALQALAKYGALTYPGPRDDSTVPLVTELQILNGKNATGFWISPENATVLQSAPILNIREPISINLVENSNSTNSAGVLFGQLVYSYYRETLNSDAPFFCSQEIKELRAGNRLQLDLCCNYTKTGKSNMALAEIESLTGYRFDGEQINTLRNIEDLQRVELQKDDTKMNVYFNPLGSKPVCLSLYSDVTYQVADLKPANFRLIDYYDPEDQLKFTYSPKMARSLGEKCGEDCWPPPPSETPIPSNSEDSDENGAGVQELPEVQ
ncbi:unnamed protein product [Caenorhabditis angaria]|uniref:TEP1-F n=1 Tax=Caenorhabditis angaria TaxID=860376 RepID=A0A9P1I7T0_9PELO|nr:unnamed protein product [Caenorhabditis angaria]